MGAHLGGLGGVTEGRVSAGCGAAIVSNGHILLVKRRRPPERGCWNLPGGKVDHLERIEDAIRREILEETGLAIRLTPMYAALNANCDSVFKTRSLRIQK